MKTKLSSTKCMTCGKKLQCERWNKAFPKQIGVVYGATFWRSHGNYGSTAYDPMSGLEYLEIVICDECLKSAAKKKRVSRVEEKHETKVVSYEEFHVRRLDQEEAYKPENNKPRKYIYANGKKMGLRHKKGQK